MVTKNDQYALESVLHDVADQGYVLINKHKLWRLLGKGSGAAGTWRELLDIWVEIHSDHKRSDLHCFEYGHQYFISYVKTDPMQKWAGEV